MPDSIDDFFSVGGVHINTGKINPATAYISVPIGKKHIVRQNGEEVCEGSSYLCIQPRFPYSGAFVFVEPKDNNYENTRSLLVKNIGMAFQLRELIKNPEDFDSIYKKAEGLGSLPFSH